MEASYRSVKIWNNLHARYCGNEHIVRRSGGIVSLAPVVDSLVKIETGVDKTASELAIRRLKEDIADLNKKLDDVNQQYASKIIYGIILAAIGGFMILGFFMSESGYGLAIFGLLGVVIGIRIVIYGMKGTNEEKKLEQALKGKKDELKRHENIVKQQSK